MIISKKKVVYIGLDPKALSPVLRRILPDLVTQLRQKHGCAILVPWELILQNTGVRRVRKLRSVENLNTSRNPLCVFLTESLEGTDTSLGVQIRAAQAKKIRRIGIILKGQASQLISAPTFEMFRTADTNYATAVHTLEETVRLVVQELLTA